MSQSKFSTRSTLIFGAYLVFFGITLWAFILPFLAERHFREGYNFFMLKRYRFSIEELETAKRLAPWETHYMVQLGRAYEEYAKQQPTLKRKLEYWDEAEALYLHMITLDWLNPWYQNRLALTYQELSNLVPEKKEYYLGLAEERTKKAAELDKQNPLFQLNYASFLHRQGKLDDAEKYYRLVMSYDPSMVEARYNLADIYRKRGDLDTTLKLYEEAFEINPKFRNLAVALASTYLQLDDKEKAIFYLESAIETNPRQLEALKTLGSMYFTKEDWPNTERAYKLLLKYFPQQYKYHQYLVQALVKQGKAAEAYQRLEQHIKQFPQDKISQTQFQQLTNILKKRKK